MSTPFVRSITAEVLSHGLPQDICLNVNIPSSCEIKGVKVVRTARGYWTDEYAEYKDPIDRPFYMLTGHFHNLEPDCDETDEYWLARDYVTIVPSRVDMTAKEEIEPLKSRLKI